MFFHPLLLHHQHKMKLSVPWLAATLGVKKVKTQLIIECNITQLHGFIMQFLNSDSRDPSKRLSLRLSIMLIHGLILIWRQQVVLLIAEIDTYIKSQEVELKRLLDLLREKPGVAPKPKKKGKKRVIVETPQSLNVSQIERDQPEKDLLEPLNITDLFQEGEIQPARLDEITLREDMPRVQAPFADDFGEPGMDVPPPAVPEIEALAVPAEEPQLAQPPVQEDVELLPVPQAPVVPTEELQLAPPLVQEELEVEAPLITVLPASPGEKEPRLEKSVAIETIEEVALAKEGEKEREKPVKGKEAVAKRADEKDAQERGEGAAAAPIDPELEWLQFCDIAPVLVPPPQGAAKKKAKTIAEQLRIKPRKKKIVPINQPLRIFNDEEDYTELIKEITKRLPDFVPMKKFWPDLEEIIEQRPEDVVVLRAARTTGTGTSTSSLELRVDTPSVGSLGQTLPSVEVPSSGPKYVSTPTKRPLPVDETMIEVLPPAANGILEHPQSPKKRRKVVSIEEVAAAELPMKELEDFMEPITEHEIRREEVIALPVEEQPPQMEIVTAEPTKGQTTEMEIVVERQEAVLERERERVSPSRSEEKFDHLDNERYVGIMRIVDQYVRITPVDICKELGQRLTKLNMALIFASLLEFRGTTF